MFKIDLHTHSIGSPDGGITFDEYRQILESETLNYLAVTDHDRLDIALLLNQQLGEQIIVGEEIKTSQGEIIGLFLTKLVKAGQSAEQTCKAIHAQGGLVYIPHPFETARAGIEAEVLDKIRELVDIVEIHNGRAFAQNRGRQATEWAKASQKAGCSSSDAHGLKGLGTSFAVINTKPTPSNLVKLLDGSTQSTKRPPIHTLLHPKINRLKKKVRK